MASRKKGSAKKSTKTAKKTARDVTPSQASKGSYMLGDKNPPKTNFGRRPNSGRGG
jgi:hypothetical protein